MICSAIVTPSQHTHGLQMDMLSKIGQSMLSRNMASNLFCSCIAQRCTDAFAKTRGRTIAIVLFINIFYFSTWFADVTVVEVKLLHQGLNVFLH